MHIKCKAHARLYKYSSGFHTYKNVPLHPYYFLHSSAKKQMHIKCKAHARLYKYSFVFHTYKHF